MENQTQKGLRARVTVTLKKGILDPQGRAIETALAHMGISEIKEVRQGKVFDLVLAHGTEEGASSLLEKACKQLLANTVIEDYSFSISAKKEHENAADEVVS